MRSWIQKASCTSWGYWGKINFRIVSKRQYVISHSVQTVFSGRMNNGGKVGSWEKERQHMKYQPWTWILSCTLHCAMVLQSKGSACKKILGGPIVEIMTSWWRYSTQFHQIIGGSADPWTYCRSPPGVLSNTLDSPIRVIWCLFFSMQKFPYDGLILGS